MLAARAGACAAALAAVVACSPGAARATAAAQQPRGCGDLLDAAPTSPERVGTDPSSIAVADFDADGAQDLAVPHRRGITLLRGDGSGDFEPARVGLPATVNRRTVAVGRFDGNASDDLAVQDTAGPALAILPGDGAGGFPGALPGPAPFTGPLGLAAGDVNGDARQDLVITTIAGAAVGSSAGRGELGVLLGDGTGRFAPAPGGARRLGDPGWPVLGDFDEDGRLDVVVREQGGDLELLVGDGAGGFAPHQAGPIDVDRRPVWVAAGAFDRDRHLDLAVADDASAFLLLGEGEGRFREAPGSRLTSEAPANATPADYNGDGRLDLAVTSLARGDVTVGLGDGRGRLLRTPGTQRAGGTVFPDAVASGDFDGDDRPDLALVNPRTAGGRRVTILLNTGARARAGARYRARIATPRPARRIALGDAVTVSASLRCGGRAPGGVRLSLERRRLTRTVGPWREIAVATTSAEGIARRRHRPQVTVQYRWRLVAGEGLRAALGRRVRVRVRRPTRAGSASPASAAA